MNTTVFLHGGMESLRIEAEADDGSVWIRGDGVTIALSLTDAQREALRAAMKVAATVEDELSAPAMRHAEAA